jgi:hypothetical protein
VLQPALSFLLLFSPFLAAVAAFHLHYSGVPQSVPPTTWLVPPLRHQPAQKKCPTIYGPPSAGRGLVSSVPPQNPALISQAKKSVPGGWDTLRYSTVDYELREKNNKIHHPKSSPQIHQIQLYLLVRDYKVSMVVNITYHNTLTPIDLCQFNTQIGAGSSSSSSK